MPAGKLNKNARRRGEQLQHPAGMRRQIPRRHRRKRSCRRRYRMKNARRRAGFQYM
ncbi:MAG: hypothetical protein ACLR23_23355 [Clostridia bacterium]